MSVKPFLTNWEQISIADRLFNHLRESIKNDSSLIAALVTINHQSDQKYFYVYQFLDAKKQFCYSYLCKLFNKNPFVEHEKKPLDLTTIEEKEINDEIQGNIKYFEEMLQILKPEPYSD